MYITLYSLPVTAVYMQILYIPTLTHHIPSPQVICPKADKMSSLSKKWTRPPSTSSSSLSTLVKWR